MGFVLLIYMEFVEIHSLDRVMQQFGLIQHILVATIRLERYERHKSMDSLLQLSERERECWATHQPYIVHQAQGLEHNIENELSTYLSWYWSIIHHYISTLILRPQGFVEIALARICSLFKPSFIFYFPKLFNVNINLFNASHAFEIYDQYNRHCVIAQSDTLHNAVVQYDRLLDIYTQSD